ncbi:MAG TPA: sodium:proline symporter [Ruminococcaceae bacterium]|nr:sodium:proline symporter [Oscillospiraceae bacterium]
MTTAQICIMIVMVVYLAAMVIIGALYSKRTNNVGEFYLGGRKLGPIVTAMSAEASDMSSWLLMGLPGVAYVTGICDAGWTAIGLGVGTYFNWLIVAKRLRNYSANIGAITIPDFFSSRYKEKKNILMAIAAIIIVIFFVPYTASGFAACGKLFGTLFGVDYHIAMIVSAIIIVGYTSLGGFNAASTTDLIQSIVMTIALVIVLVFGITQAGGWDAVMANAQSLKGYLSMFDLHDVATGGSNSYGPLKILSTMAWGLGYFGMPHILLRFMAIENPDKIKLSRRVATIWVVISMSIGILIGVIGLGMVANNALAPLEDSETIVIQIANLLSQNGIGLALVAGVIISGILACTMSTSDSQLLAASSSVSENILGGLFKLNLSEKTKMIVARAVLIIIAVIGVVIAWDSNSSVFGIVSFAWAGFGAAFGPVMLLALFWKRSNKYGAIAGMIAGGAMVFIWKYVIAGLAEVLNVYELLPAFITGLAVNVIVSLVTPKPEQEILDEFDAAKATK